MASALATVPRATADTLSWYLARVNAAPMLTAEEERSLARRFRETGDQEAAKALIISHLRLVVRVAKGYLAYGLDPADLIQEGTIGLMRAVKRYEPERGVRLAPFAVHFIRAHIQEFVLRNWRIVKVATTKAQRKLFFKLRRYKSRLERLGRQEAEAIAAALDVTRRDVEIMDGRLYGADAVIAGSGDEEIFEGGNGWTRFLSDTESNPSDQYEAYEDTIRRTRQLEQALGALDARSRDIIERRWLRDDKATLEELGGLYGISKERVRQIEKNAFTLLRTRLSGDPSAGGELGDGRRGRSAAKARLLSPAAEHRTAAAA